MRNKSGIRWRVEINYETMAGDPAVRIYNIEASNEISAIKLAQIRLERLKSFKKTYGGSAVQVLSK